MLAGASLALAGFAGCSPRSREKIVPYADQPEQIIPGKPLVYATAIPLNGYGRGILGDDGHGPPRSRSRVIRRILIASARRTRSRRRRCSGLWDPDRSQAPFFNGHISTWNKFESELLTVLKTAGEAQGEGPGRADGAEHVADVAAADGRTVQEVPQGAGFTDWSPTCGRQPLAVRPGDFDAGQSGPDRLGGQRLPSWINPAACATCGSSPRAAGCRMGKRRPNRLYVLEGTPTITGTMADERLRRAARTAWRR